MRLRDQVVFGKEMDQTRKKKTFLIEGSSRQEIIYTQTRSASPDDDVLEKHKVLISQKKGPVTDAYEFLRTQVTFQMKAQGWKVLAISSPTEGEGKTLTAVNLAISIAKKLDTTILLVDGDLGSPSIHRYLDLNADKGLIDYIVNETPIEDLLLHPSIDRLIVLPGGQPVENAVELIECPKMAALVQEIKHRYDSRMIIFDLPPILDRADTLAFSPYIDAMLLVVQAGKTQKSDVARALRLIGKTPVIGTVLNQGT